jgi:hypothetical protein
MLSQITTISLCVGIPAIVFSFVYLLNKSQEEVKKLQLQKEILELEIEKERVHLLKIEAESKQYDRLINS